MGKYYSVKQPEPPVEPPVEPLAEPLVRPLATPRRKLAAMAAAPVTRLESPPKSWRMAGPSFARIRVDSTGQEWTDSAGQEEGTAGAVVDTPRSLATTGVADDPITPRFAPPLLRFRRDLSKVSLGGLSIPPTPPPTPMACPRCGYEKSVSSTAVRVQLREVVDDRETQAALDEMTEEMLNCTLTGTDFDDERADGFFARQQVDRASETEDDNGLDDEFFARVKAERAYFDEHGFPGKDGYPPEVTGM